ncbi:hypothetical protein [Streptomyces sp. NPDC046727]|uniref:hypothetical protein n=1 Tax=Streptomyces sp. NPDC046727 TaxID=3155373 RepID=UPI003406C4D7
MIPRPGARTGTGGPSPAGSDRRLVPPMALGSVRNPVDSSSPALFTLVGSALLPATIPPGRSLGRRTSRTTRKV